MLPWLRAAAGALILLLIARPPHPINPLAACAGPYSSPA